MRVARARKVIGVRLSADEMAEIFTRLGLAFARDGEGGDEAFMVAPPSFRFDLEIEEDLIEEVARVYGFERIPANPPRAVAAMRTQPESQRSLHELRDLLAGADYQEVVNFSFVDADWEAELGGNANPIRLLNPIASHQSVMRSTLIGGLVDNIRYNVARKQSRVRVFEIGRVFCATPRWRRASWRSPGYASPCIVAGAAFGPALDEQWGAATRGVDFYDLKADLEALVAPLQARFEAAPHPALHPGRAARVLLDGQEVGWIGELHPRWQQNFELPRPPVLFELDAAPLQSRGLPTRRDPSRFPPVIRDLAVLVDSGLPAQALIDAIFAEKHPIVQGVRLFDVYQGKSLPEGKKSLAFRIVMQDTQKHSRMRPTPTQAIARAVREPAAPIRHDLASLRS